MRPAVLRLLLACATLLAASLLQEAGAQGRLEASEASVKAAFLYKFPGYIEWPPNAFASPAAPFTFGVMGQDEVAAELERLTAGKKWSTHPMAVRRVEGDNLKGLQVLFVGRNAAERLGTVIRAAQLPGLLVVTENEKGLAYGAAINFVLHEDRVGFEVAPEAAEKNGLRISSRMLAVARRVVQR
jgi:hypothetical protein